MFLKIDASFSLVVVVTCHSLGGGGASMLFGSLSCGTSREDAAIDELVGSAGARSNGTYAARQHEWWLEARAARLGEVAPRFVATGYAESPLGQGGIRHRSRCFCLVMRHVFRASSQHYARR